MVNDLRINDYAYKIDPNLTAMQNFRRIPEKVRAEVIDGKLYILTKPLFNHALIATDLYLRLHSYARRHKVGMVWLDALDVWLDRKRTVVEPDIIFVADSSKKCKAARDGYDGPPDLIIEILSQSNKKHDRIRKKNLYEEKGVKEYWIVNPETGEAQGFLRKRDGKFSEPLILHHKIHVRLFDKTFKFTEARVFKDSPSSSTKSRRKA